MATIDLGKIKFNWRGTYAGGTAYVPDDVVYYVDGSVGSSYMCVANTTGNAPSSGGTLHASWQYLAKGQAVSPTTTQGDIIVRGASADGRLAIGDAGKVLKVNSGANGLEYGDASILQRVYSWIDNTQVCPPSTAGGSSTGSNVFSYTITAKTANPYYEINWNFTWGLNSSGADANEIHAIAGIFNSSNQLVYGFGYKKGGGGAGGSSTYRANSTFRAQTGDYVLLDSDAGIYSNDSNWSTANVNILSFGNRLESNNGAPGRCGDGGTTGGVSAGDTLTLKGYVGSGNDGCYNRTTNSVTKLDYAIITLKEYSSIGQ